MSPKDHIHSTQTEPSSNDEPAAVAHTSSSVESETSFSVSQPQLKLQEQVNSSDRVRHLMQFQKLADQRENGLKQKFVSRGDVPIQRVKITNVDVPGLEVELDTEDVTGFKKILVSLKEQRKYDVLEQIDSVLRKGGHLTFLLQVIDELDPKLKVGADLPMIPLKDGVFIKWWVGEGAGKVDFHHWNKVIGKAIWQIVESHDKRGTTFKSETQAINIIYKELQKTEAYQSFELAVDSKLKEYEDQHKDPQTSECPIFISATKRAFGVDRKHPEFEQLTLAAPNAVFRWKVQKQDDRFEWYTPEWKAEGDIWESIPADQCTDNTLMTLGFGGAREKSGTNSRISSREDHQVSVKGGASEAKSEFHTKNTEAHYEVAWEEIKQQAITDQKQLAPELGGPHLAKLIQTHLDSVELEEKYFDIADQVMKIWGEFKQSPDYDLATMYEAVGRKPRNAESNKRTGKSQVDKILFPGEEKPDHEQRFKRMESVELAYAINKFKEEKPLTSFQHKLLLDHMDLKEKGDEYTKAEMEVRNQLYQEVINIDQKHKLNSDRLKEHAIVATRNADQGHSGVVNMGQQTVANVGDAYLLICGVDLFWIHHIVPVVAKFGNTIFTIDKAQGLSDWSLKKYDQNHQFFHDYPSGRSMVLRMEKVGGALKKK